jgi:hypothetical protein
VKSVQPGKRSGTYHEEILVNTHTFTGQENHLMQQIEQVFWDERTGDILSNLKQNDTTTRRTGNESRQFE